MGRDISPEAPLGYRGAFHGHEFGAAGVWLMDVVTDLNRDIEQTRPWGMVKTGNRRALNINLERWSREVAKVARRLEPLTPGASRSVLDVLSRRPLCRCKLPFPRLT